MQDVIKLKNYLNGIEELSYLQLALADFNEDGITNEEDYTAILNQINSTDILINLNNLTSKTDLKFKINCSDYSYTLKYADLEIKNNNKILPIPVDFNTITVISDNNTEDISDDTVITTIDDITTPQLIRNKYSFNNEKYACEVNIMPSSNNENVNITIDSYLDGDVTLDNEVTSTDALTVLMYVIDRYNIIQTGATSLFDISHGNITVNGNISSNNTINVHASNGNFNGKITAPLIQTWGNVNAQRETTMDELITDSPFTDNQMTSIFFENTPYIDAEYNNDTYAADNNGERNNLNINQPISANTINLQNNVNINNNIKANGNINISGSVHNDTRCVIYSSDGNINLESTNFSFTGLIYAPNGTVTITGKNINITGTIIAKEVIIDGDTINFNANNNFLNYTNISDKFLDLTDTYLSDLQLFIADMDNDNNVTAYDAECILNKVVNNN